MLIYSIKDCSLEFLDEEKEMKNKEEKRRNLEKATKEGYYSILFHYEIILIVHH